MVTRICSSFRTRKEKNSFVSIAGGLGMLVCAIAVDCLYGADDFKTQSTEGRKPMNSISGEFDVKLNPVDTGDAQMGMMLLDKSYRGDLQATGTGRMLTGMTSVKGSAAYVAIERIEGELKGKRGGFLIQHSGTMTNAKQSLVITVVPDSGTGDLVGIEGTMKIRIVDKKHFYDFDYSLK